ncbi:hypothetical protein KSP40_PGU006390 [Platanthera guangdongensis]|uniref:Uncharacterized protein n=1 Tax=Platanthera guangdongensis TaxID=2320717 RepID=A0ABR2LEZ5_9ASPA
MIRKVAVGTVLEGSQRKTQREFTGGRISHVLEGNRGGNAKWVWSVVEDGPRVSEYLWVFGGYLSYDIEIDDITPMASGSSNVWSPSDVKKHKKKEEKEREKLFDGANNYVRPRDAAAAAAHARDKLSERQEKLEKILFESEQQPTIFCNELANLIHLYK